MTEDATFGGCNKIDVTLQNIIKNKLKMICDVLFTLQINVWHKENKPFDQDNGDSDKIRFWFSRRNVR